MQMGAPSSLVRVAALAAANLLCIEHRKIFGLVNP